MILFFSGIPYFFYAILYSNFLVIHGSDSTTDTAAASTTAAVSTSVVAAFDVASTAAPELIDDKLADTSTRDFSYLLASAKSAIHEQEATMGNLIEIIMSANTSDVAQKTEIAAVEEAIQWLRSATKDLVDFNDSCNLEISQLKLAMNDVMQANKTVAELSPLFQEQLDKIIPIKSNAAGNLNLLTTAMNQSVNVNGITVDVFNRSLQATASVVLAAFVINKLTNESENLDIQNNLLRKKFFDLQNLRQKTIEKRNTGEKKLETLKKGLKVQSSLTMMKNKSKSDFQRKIHNAMRTKESLANATSVIKKAIELVEAANESATNATTELSTQMSALNITDSAVLSIKLLLAPINNESEIRDAILRNITSNLNASTNIILVANITTLPMKSLMDLIQTLGNLTIQFNQSNANGSGLIENVQTLKTSSFDELANVTQELKGKVGEAKNRSIIANKTLNSAVIRLNEEVNRASSAESDANRETLVLKEILGKANQTSMKNETDLQAEMSNATQQANTTSAQVTVTLNESISELHKSGDVLISADNILQAVYSKMTTFAKLSYEGQTMQSILDSKIKEIIEDINSSSSPISDSEKTGTESIETIVEETVVFEYDSGANSVTAFSNSTTSRSDGITSSSSVSTTNAATTTQTSLAKNATVAVVIIPNTTAKPAEKRTSSIILIASLIAAVILLAILASVVIYILMRKGYIKFPNRARSELKADRRSPAEPSLLSDASPSRR